MTYTAGELAKKLGVSARTVRFYDEKNLLCPCGYSEAGYRLYNDDSAKQLQKIIMLRFLDFSLEQIREIMQENGTGRTILYSDLEAGYNGEGGEDLRSSLREQELLLLEKKERIERIISAVRKMQETPTEEELWENMRHIIEMTKEREGVIEQYRKEDNLNKRISIHDYSTSEVGFYDWMFTKLALAPNMKVLDIGCGNAVFWKMVAPMLPSGLEVHLVDYSAGMLAGAEKNAKEIQRLYPEKGLRFVLEKRDATDFSYPVSDFDRIMANHMLYHLSRESRLDLYPKLQNMLAENGRFSCSLIGKTHLQELHDFIKEYYPNISIPSEAFDIWLETAGEELKPYFTVLSVEEQENDLLVPEEELVLNYVASYSEEAKQIVQADRERFSERVRAKMNEKGCMYIHKSTGIVVCKKRPIDKG